MIKYIKLSLKYMLKYRKRTITLVLSILLSTFFIVTMGSLSQSSRNAEVENVKRATGIQHVIYRELNEADLVKIENNQKVKNAANMFYYDTWVTAKGLAVNLLGAEKDMLYMEDTQMLAGQFPSKANEIALEAWVLERLGLPGEVGQTINISLQQNGKIQKYKLTGIIKDRLDEKATGNMEGYVAYNKESLFGREEHIHSLVEFKENTNILKEIEALGKTLKRSDEQIMINKMLLSVMGEMQGIDWQVVKTAVILMLVGGMVIYSIYSISALRRIQEYGILRAVGSTKKQLMYIMLGEIGIIYIVGAGLGVLGGSLFIHLFKGIHMGLFITESLGDTLDVIVISFGAVKLALIMGMGSVLAAGVKAAWIAAKISPIEAMRRSTQDKGIAFKDKEGWLERFLSTPNKISYKNLMRHKKALIFTAVTMTIGSSLYMVGSFREKMFDRDREYYNHLYKSKQYEFKLNINAISPMKQTYSVQDIKELEKLPQVEDILGRGLLYSRIEFPKTTLNGEFGKNYLQEMQRRVMNLRIQSKEPVEGKSGFAFESDDKKNIIIHNTILGLSEDELKPLQKNLVMGRIPNETSSDLQAIAYVPKVTEKGTFFDATGKNKRKPAINLKVGDKIKVSYPKAGYEKFMENYVLITDYEKYNNLYTSREVIITGIIEDLPVKDDFQSGTDCAPYLLMTEKDFKKLTGIEGYRILSIDMKDSASEIEYEDLKKRVQALSEVIPGTNLTNQVEFQKHSKEFDRQYTALRNTIAAVLMLISGLSIYNNISYNLLSRRREYGIMKAIGLTGKQFRKMIRFEGLAYGGIAAFFACSIALIIEIGVFVFWAYMSSFPLYNKQFFFDWEPYVLVIAMNLLIGYLATVEPIYQVNKAEITESIRTIE